LKIFGFSLEFIWNFLRIFFGMNFLGGSFRKDFFGRNLLGGFFGEEFLGGILCLHC
jgi:hypothetical protein